MYKILRKKIILYIVADPNNIAGFSCIVLENTESIHIYWLKTFFVYSIFALIFSGWLLKDLNLG